MWELHHNTCYTKQRGHHKRTAVPWQNFLERPRGYHHIQRCVLSRCSGVFHIVLLLLCIGYSTSTSTANATSGWDAFWCLARWYSISLFHGSLFNTSEFVGYLGRNDMWLYCDVLCKLHPSVHSTQLATRGRQSCCTLEAEREGTSLSKRVGQLVGWV
ncbi:Hypothetical protein PHPALM_5399, partial [Phytophthora palmivora]